MDTTASAQDYLKAIYAIWESGMQITTSAIAERLGVSPASVTAMIKKLAASGHIRHERYQGVELTRSGRLAALEIVRHHRLLESYLHQTLGIPWDRVHDEADRLEHALSEEVEDKIASALGNPTRDPHGDPIPPKRGKHTEIRHDRLEQISDGPAVIERVSDRDPEVLRYLERIGMKPGTKIIVEEHAPFGGPVWVRVGKKRHAIGLNLASVVYVSKAS